MDEPYNPPLGHANRIIQRFVDNSESNFVILPKDYLVIRAKFRQLGGSWEALSLGDPQQTQLLYQVVKAWGQVPGRVKREDRLLDL